MPKKLLAIFLTLMLLLVFVPATVFAEETDGQIEIQDPLPEEEFKSTNPEVTPNSGVIPSQLEIKSTATQVVFPAAIKDIFPDANLARAIADKLGKTVEEQVAQSDLEVITDLWLERADIKSIKNIEYLINLRTLDLTINQISDISPLAGLANLTKLYLYDNSISDISVLADLTNLKELDLGCNFISNISPLSSLTNLTHLYARDQVISISSNKKIFNNPIINISGIVIHPKTFDNCTYDFERTQFEFEDTVSDAKFSFENNVNNIYFSGDVTVTYTGTPTTTSVAGVSLNPTSATLTVPEAQQLSATLTPDNATNKDLTWSSSNEAVATVDQSGLVTAVGKGSATITVTTADGGFSAVCNVTVNLPLVGSYHPNKLPSSVIKGNSIEVQLMSGAVSQSITSSNSKVITVNGNLLQFVGTGSAKVTVKYQSVNAKGKTITTTVTKTITVTSKVEGVSLNTDNATIARKGTVTLKAYILPADSTNKTVIWSTSNKKVATVTNKGVVAGVGAGTCTITAKTKDGGYAAYATITVTPIYETAIKLNKTSVSLAKGNTFQLKASFTPSNTDFKAVAWGSDNPDVATVDSKGKVKAFQTGTCTITATSANGKVASCTVTTLPQKVTSVKFGSTSSTYNAGQSVTIPLTVGPANADNRDVIWSSSNNGIATVTQDGTVMFRFAGKVTIKATTQDDSKKFSSKTFTVKGFILGEYLKYDIPPEDLTDKRFAAMIQEAEKYLGYPYVWGGSSPSTSFDCSGFVCWVINQSKVGKVGRITAQSLYNKCKPVAASDAKPGDLIFFTETYATSRAVTHVGIYVGNRMMIHCGDPISYQSIDTPHYTQHFYAFGRLP